jgi:hypothetical protein
VSFPPWRLLYHALLAVGLAACSPDPYEPRPGAAWCWEVDPAFSAPERAVLASAAERWTERGHVRHDLTDGPCWRRIVQATPEQRATMRDGANWSGFFDDETQTLYLVDVRAAEHELGHALGLGHVSAGVMAAQPGAEWTDADAAECRRVGACE